MTELFLFNTEEEVFLAPLGKTHDQFLKENPIETSSSKMYILATKLHAQKLGFKLKRLNMTFVAPLVSNKALQYEQYHNKAIKNIGGIAVDLKVFTLEQFINELFTLIPDSKWYIKDNHIPFIALSKSKVEILQENNLAVIM